MMKERLLAAITALAMLTTPLAAIAETTEVPTEVVTADTAVAVSAELSAVPTLSATFAAVEAENRFAAHVTLENSAAEEQSAALIFAYYRANDSLLETETLTLTVPGGGTFARTYLAADDLMADAAYARAYLWTDLASMKPLAPALDSRDGVRYEYGEIPLSLSTVWATDEQSSGAHTVAQALDCNVNTYLAGQSFADKPVSVYAELPGRYTIDVAELAFHLADSRDYQFDLAVSEDGVNYRTVLRDADASASLTAYTPLDAYGRYVRLNLYGWGGNPGWVRLSALRLYGTRMAGETEELMYNSFTALDGVRLSESASAQTDGWSVHALNEETYTDYTPALGSMLYGMVSPLPNAAGLGIYNPALVLYDNVGREDGDSGSGAIGAVRALELPDNDRDYTISFRMMIPANVGANEANFNWAGFSLSYGAPTGGADRTTPVAAQIRLYPGENGTVRFGVIDSVQFNEGYYRAFLGETVPIRAHVPLDITLDVSPKGKSVRMTVSDGENVDSGLLPYAYTDVDKVNNQTWVNALVNTIMFNTGAGGKCLLYIDDFRLTQETLDEIDTGVLLYENTFDAASLADAGVTAASVVAVGATTPSMGLNSTTLLADLSTRSGMSGKVLRLHDATADGGVFAYLPLTVPSNQSTYTIRFQMTASAFANYSGFSLAHGANSGGNDTTNPCALQVRFSAQSDGIQLNEYTSVQFNDGTFGAFMATGAGNRLAKTVWSVAIEVNPLAQRMTLTITDGSRTLTRTAAYESTNSDGTWTPDWQENPIDTLIFTTRFGGSDDLYIDNVTVRDSGVISAAGEAAEQGLVRLQTATGRGRFLNYTVSQAIRPEAPSQPIAVVRLASGADTDPAKTRFVERPGLGDPSGVSFEIPSQPGYYLIARETDEVNHTFSVTAAQYEDTAQFRAKATFYKQSAANAGAYTGTTVTYVPMWDPSRHMAESGNAVAIDASGSAAGTDNVFYLRRETVNFVSDNFKGNAINSQWRTNYPWKSNNPTNDSYNFSALITHRNVIVEDGKLLLKATKASGWPTNTSGETGINYNGKYNYIGGTAKGYVRWQGYVGVISSTRIFHRQSLVEGRFKQPESPMGYWNAFWLNAASGWPPETDIFEYMSHRGVNTWYTATHNTATTGFGGWQTVNGINVRTGFHTFTLDWGYDYMKFYVDGTRYATVTGADVDKQNNGVQMILNTGVGGWGTEPSDQDAIDTYGEMVWDTGMECDWIRSFSY